MLRTSKFNREIDALRIRQEGERAYAQARSRVGDVFDSSLESEAAYLVALKVNIKNSGRDVFVRGWLDAREAELRRRERLRGPELAILRGRGSRAYLAAHARSGSSQDVRLGLASARHAAAKLSSDRDDQEAFVNGWLDERERHSLERVQYTGEPYVPISLSLIPRHDED